MAKILYYILMGILFFLASSLAVLNSTTLGTLQFYQSGTPEYIDNPNECYTIDEMGVKQPCMMGERHISNLILIFFVFNLMPWLIVGALSLVAIFIYKKKIRIIKN